MSNCPSDFELSSVIFKSELKRTETFSGNTDKQTETDRQTDRQTDKQLRNNRKII